ncbi:MAG: gliding motility protein GldL [Bacteroides sp.]|nr:gliding motility protein GldL [Bacteroides sp.]MCM1378507.1 gliding motility protein GldL [Bacteroides sp.]MCM1444808.1 gliding motility protein GldL [Prevotella sp.]
MTKIKKYKNAVERFLSGENGARFFNFAYSIGAAVVIWGALFKLLHLPGGNLLLMIGMGTEVLMFILSAFDRPAKQYHWEEVFPVLDTHDAEDRPDLSSGAVVSGTVVSGGVVSVAPGVGQQSAAAIAADAPLSLNASAQEATEHYVAQIAALSEQMAELRKSTEELNKVTSVLLESYHAITENSDRITASSQGYVDEMTSLNRNVAGLNTIYEIQLKSVSSQLDSIDRVNNGIKDIRDMYERSADTSRQYCEETERMALYMQQLNSIYAQMIQAMTQNLPHSAAPKVG